MTEFFDGLYATVFNERKEEFRLRIMMWKIEHKRPKMFIKLSYLQSFLKQSVAICKEIPEMWWNQVEIAANAGPTAKRTLLPRVGGWL